MEKKRLRMWWAIASAIWVLVMANMSFQDLKYGVQYHLFGDRVKAAHQEKLEAYEQAKREGDESIRMLLQSAKRYDDLQLQALTAKRTGRISTVPRHAQNESASGEPRSQSVYERTLDEIASLENTYGKTRLRKYREHDGGTEQFLRDELHAGLIVPRMREPRLAAVLFHMLASPLVLLLALMFHEKAYRRLPILQRYFGAK